MNKTVDIIHIYSLRGYVNSGGLSKVINEWYTKKNHVSKVKDYRPESEMWLKMKEEDNRINEIPDHDVVMTIDDLIIEYGSKRLELSIGKVSYVKNVHNYEDDDVIEQKFTSTFLVENSYWGTGLICSFDELISHPMVQEMIEDMFNDQIYIKWRDHLNTICDGVFMLLLDKIVRSEKNLVPVRIYSNGGEVYWVEIGDDKYYEKEMRHINEVFKNDDYVFYDDNDKRIEYCVYMYDSFPDFYRKYSTVKN